MDDYQIEKINKERRIFFIIVPLFLIIALIGVSLAFFNYTRTGASNVIKVGRISFVSKNEQTISLTNLFPIDPEDTNAMNDNTKVGTYTIEIKGDTDYADGVEYLVSTVDANIYTSTGKTVPISLDMTVTTLGTENANYFTAREDKNATIYKKLVGGELVGDQMLLVGYIKKNTTTGTAEGVDGSITIKAYLDKNKILISDTYDGTESDNMGTPNSMAQGKTVLTTQEWNSLQSSGVSFKVRVEANEGIWVTGSLEEIMKKTAVMDNTTSPFVSASSGINFGAISSDTNGKGVYMRAGTQNDDYPIMYYRGAVENNNVKFANKCWKAVRTTDTGGVKLIYNGELSPILTEEFNNPDTYATEHEGDVFTFDATDSTWNFEVNDGQDHEISFKVPEGENYDMVVSGTTGSTCGLSFRILKNGNTMSGGGSGGGSPINTTYSYGTLTTSDELELSIYGASSTSSSCTINVKVNMQQGSTKLTKSDYSMLVKKNSGEYGCENIGNDAHISINGTNSFAFSGTNLYRSPAYVGYMYGTVYVPDTSYWASGAYFGSGFTWDGTSYKLVDATENSPTATHHYSCNSVNAETTCTTLRYVYHATDSFKHFIRLTDGDGIEEAIKKMQTNTNDSNAKAMIDAWYASNDSNMTNYTNKLEDTIWCNDRSMGRANGWSETGSWGTDNYKQNALLFGAHERSNSASDTSLVKNQPSLTCVNKNDRFTVHNGNGNRSLTYPTALLTEDEIVLAGKSTSYLKSNAHWWSLSPDSFEGANFGTGMVVHIYHASEYYVNSNGTLNPYPVDGDYGLRPSISIKPGQLITKGTGTAVDPYVIE